MTGDPILTKGTEAASAVLARTYPVDGEAGSTTHAAVPGDTVVVAVTPTQVRRPWRSTARTVFQALTGIAPMAPVIYQAATDHDPALASGAAGAALAISAGVTRVMAIPGVETWLRRFVPFLAAAPKA